MILVEGWLIPAEEIVRGDLVFAEGRFGGKNYVFLVINYFLYEFQTNMAYYNYGDI